MEDKMTLVVVDIVSTYGQEVGDHVCAAEMTTCKGSAQAADKANPNASIEEVVYVDLNMYSFI